MIKDIDLWFESERKSACVYNWQDRLTQAEPDQALKEQGLPNEAYAGAPQATA